MFEGSSFWYLHRILNCCRQIFWPLLFEKVNSTLVWILLIPYFGKYTRLLFAMKKIRSRSFCKAEYNIFFR